MSPRPKNAKSKHFQAFRFRLKKHARQSFIALVAAVVFGTAGYAYIFFSSAQRGGYDDEPEEPYSYVAPNPTVVTQSCMGGLNIGLVADVSGSITRNDRYFSGMKTALKNFISNLLPSTHTQFALTSFDSEAEVLRPLTNNVAALTSDIDNMRGGGGTNWTAGLQTGYSTLSSASSSAPSVIIIATDGDPSEPRGRSLAGAVEQANIIKEAGIHVLALGIGQLNVENLKAISGPIVNRGGVNSDVITTDFDTLNSALEEIAGTTCTPGSGTGTGGNGNGNNGNGNGNGGTGNGNGVGGTGTGSNGVGNGNNGKGNGASGTGTGTSTGKTPQPSPTPVPTATQGTTPSPAPTPDPQNDPAPAPAATQTTEPTPIPAPTPTAQGVQTKSPEPDASPFIDGKTFARGITPDSYTPPELRKASYAWAYLLGIAVIVVTASSLLIWRKRKLPGKAVRRGKRL